MSCRTCAWAADTAAAVRALAEGATLAYPHSHADPDALWSAAFEAHRECGEGRSCTCQHWINPGDGHALVSAISPKGWNGPYPTRCSACYRRVAVSPKGGKIACHKIPGNARQRARCPGSGKSPLMRDTAVTVIWSAQSNSEME